MLTKMENERGSDNSVRV